MPYQPAKWHFDISAFAQLTSLSGVVKARGETVNPGSSYSDVQWGLHAEAAKKSWILLLEGSYLKLTEEAVVQGGTTPAEIEVKQFIVDGAVAYRVGAPTRSFAFVGGVRYQDLQGTTTVEGQAPTTGSQSFWDPYLGMRLHWDTNPKLPIVLRGDVGGLQISDVSLSWRLTLGAGYRVSDSFALSGGWRWYDVEYNTPSGPDQFIWDVNQNGPFLGLTLGF
jgi:opacity protein-like surface antigen